MFALNPLTLRCSAANTYIIVRAWSPLLVESDERMREMVRVTRRRLRAPQEFFNAWALYAYAPVARWLVVMRQMQLAEAKRRWVAMWS